jgi:AraC-like DNA-binding protein
MEERIVSHQRGKDNMYWTWHASEEHLFLYVHQGQGSLVCAQRVFPLEEGVLVFIGADVYHYTMPEVPAAYDRSKLTLAPHRMQSLCAILSKPYSLDNSVVYGKIPPEKRPVVEEIFLRGIQNEDKGELGLMAATLELMGFLQTYEAGSTAGGEGRMARAIRYINENVSQKLDIQKICDAINVSKYHFCRQFKAHTGLTVMAYLLKTRIVLAAEELKKTNLPISEISENLGFSSLSYFCRVFKQDRGVTPLQYRKQNRA